MALITVNGQDALGVSVMMPRSGLWTADLLVDDSTPLAGKATIVVNDGALVLVGTVVRSGVFVDAGHVRVVAGAGALSLNARPKHYTGTSVRIVLGDLLAAAGETLAASADPAILAIGLDAWTTAAIPAKTVIGLLLAAAAPGAIWRALPDGTIWVGRESWADAGLDPDTYQAVEDAAETASMLILVDAPALLPGTTFEGRRVSRVDHFVPMNGELISSRVWFEQGAGAATDRLKEAIGKLVRAAAPGVDYRARYWARVISQQGGTVDVQPEIDGLADMASVPLLLGIPASSVNKVSGGRVLIGWAGADPSQPYAEAFDADTALSAADGGSLAIAGGTAAAARVGDPVSLTLSPVDVTALAASMVAAGLVMAGSGGGAPAPVPVTGENVIASGSQIVTVG